MRLEQVGPVWRRCEVGQGGEEGRSREYARVKKHVVCDSHIACKLLKVGNAFLASRILELPVLKVPRSYDFITIEEEDVGRARDGVDALRSLEVCELYYVS